MPRYNLRVSDEVTYARVCIIAVTARTKAHAEDFARDLANCGLLGNLWEEDQIGNKPYSIEAADTDDVVQQSFVASNSKSKV